MIQNRWAEKIISKPVIIFGPLIVLCMLLIVKRLVFGLGSVSDLNGGFPWGVWIAFDLLIGTGFACGGWALAWAVYVFNRGQYHPLVRPALLGKLVWLLAGRPVDPPSMWGVTGTCRTSTFPVTST
ncbi:putative hydrogenase 2 b cytochrome subunit [Salmonella enterica subsp. salamae]|uniref:Putative hydrogenase 2 b cytochrome subunit n=1 Tax=Salmonella enterica subsp. salamae TaxID=59202 RepID=A0A6D2G3X4_SALER|nr:putative hydrogenase 2 b cytochrome subunit [Salmonella enterica subsp. salamae]